MSEVVYLRDLDGTGGLHACSKGDPGAIAHIPLELADQLAEALKLALDGINKDVFLYDECGEYHISESHDFKYGIIPRINGTLEAYRKAKGE